MSGLNQILIELTAFVVIIKNINRCSIFHVYSIDDMMNIALAVGF